MEILISSYYFYPENTPRAFRTFELVKEFCKLGHKVTLYLPEKEIFKKVNYSNNNLTIVFSNSVHTGNKCHVKKEMSRNITNISKNRFRKIAPKSLKRIMKNILELKVKYFQPLSDKVYLSALSDSLTKIKKDYDLFISIALPIITHIAAVKALRINKNLQNVKAKVAEYGDPFSTRKEPIFFYYYCIDYLIAKKFDFISVPTIKAVKSYKAFKDKSKIKVIPQGFDFSNIVLKSYIPNKIPTFAYAGCFYSKLRNPFRFLEYLSSLKKEYKFIVYTISESSDTRKILNKYKDNFGSKLEIILDIERSHLIKELSTFDFLINFENTSKNQTPSKLIDYTLSKRPICSISTSNFIENTFLEFFNRNYKNSIRIKLEDFDIQKVTKQFLELVNEN